MFCDGRRITEVIHYVANPLLVGFLQVSMFLWDAEYVLFDAGKFRFNNDNNNYLINVKFIYH